jgi:hypothetical protein
MKRRTEDLIGWADKKFDTTALVQLGGEEGRRRFIDTEVMLAV